MDRIVAGSRVTVLACGRWLLIALTGSILACGSGGGASNPTAADADVGDVSAEITDDGLVDSIPIADALAPDLADGESEVDAGPGPETAPDSTCETHGTDGGGETDSAVEPDGVPADVPADLGVDQLPIDASESELPVDASESDSISVLFIGNSYTFGNNLPGLVEEWAVALGLDLTTEMIAKGGALLEDHGMDPATLAAIAEAAPTYLVLQGQSYVPVVAPFTFYSGAAMLADAAHAVGSTPVFFETWARVEGHELYDGQLSGYDPASMQEVLRQAYKAATLNNNGVYAPVGDAWEKSLEQYPDLKLHGSDGSHAALTGSYLAAAVFVGLLGEVQVDAVTGIWAPDGLDESAAKMLRQMAHETLLQQ